MANHTSSAGLVIIAAATVAELMSYDIDEGISTHDDTEMSDTSETHQAGKTNWNAKIECMWDDTDATGQGAMTIGASVAVIFLPEGNTSGDVSRTGTATIESKGMSVPKDGMITQSFGLKGNGALVDGTVT
jgi:hypothetical protein